MSTSLLRRLFSSKTQFKPAAAPRARPNYQKPRKPYRSDWKLWTSRLIKTSAAGTIVMATTAATTTSSWWNVRLPSWKPTSSDELLKAEQRMLSAVETPIQQQLVDLGKHKINTIKVGSGPPLVLIHGFGAGVGFWVKNLDELSKHFTVYAIDLLGFGRSSRPSFRGSNPHDAETFWVDSIEKWRNAMGISNFALLGHSMGGFIAGCYALKYSAHVKHVILADPVGIPKKPAQWNVSWKWKAVINVAWAISPLAPVRIAGPWGPSLVSKMRADISDRFSYKDDTVSNYLYHLCAQPPSGETAFKAMFQPGAFAHNPLSERFTQLPDGMAVTFLYGNMTWTKPQLGRELGEALLKHRLLHSTGPFAPVLHDVIWGSHHLYADDAQAFNKAIVDTIAHAAAKYPPCAPLSAPTPITTPITTATTTTTTTPEPSTSEATGVTATKSPDLSEITTTQ